jgi:AP endonuclease-2
MKKVLRLAVATTRQCTDIFPGKFGVVIYTRQSVCAPVRAEEGITGILCPPNSLTSYRNIAQARQIGGYPLEEQARSAPEAPECATDFVTLDSEGRCVILEFPAFVLVGVYNPATRDESRNAFRISFLNLLDIRIRNLVAMGKRVILTGDLNIAKAAIDMANCEKDLRKAGTTFEEYFSRPARRMLNHLVDDGIVWNHRDCGREQPVLHDLCRSFHPKRQGMFTCWETKTNARPGNYGSRIDYVLCSLDLKDWFSDANIQEGLMGSDHCPVYVIMKDKVTVDGEEVFIHDIMNPPGMFSKGHRLRGYSIKDMQSLSGKLIPEFTGRRSIKDMFLQKPVSSKLPGITSNVAEPLGETESLTADTTNLLRRQGSKSLEKAQILPSAHKEAPAVMSLSASPIRTTVKRSVFDKSPTKAPKRLKSQSSSVISADLPKKGQQSLAGFFKPKTTSASTESSTTKEGVVRVPGELYDENPLWGSSRTKPSIGGPSQTSSTTMPSPTKTVESSLMSQVAKDGTVHDPIESKESWSKLFSKPAAPLCEGHEEPCRIMTTKKPGQNCGRSFWMCARPLGPSGQKEKNTQWRCGTFIWCSDLKGPS